jgi:hypothetical protein
MSLRIPVLSAVTVGCRSRTVFRRAFSSKAAGGAAGKDAGKAPAGKSSDPTKGAAGKAAGDAAKPPSGKDAAKPAAGDKKAAATPAASAAKGKGGAAGAPAAGTAKSKSASTSPAFDGNVKVGDLVPVKYIKDDKDVTIGDDSKYPDWLFTVALRRPSISDIVTRIEKDSVNSLGPKDMRRVRGLLHRDKIRQGKLWSIVDVAIIYCLLKYHNARTLCLRKSYESRGEKELSISSSI